MIVRKLWGKNITGPVAACLALVLPIVGLVVETTKTVTIWLGVAPLLLAVLLIWPAQYEAWKQERKLLEQEQAKNERPEIHGDFFGFGNDLASTGKTTYRFGANICYVRPVETSIRYMRLTVYDIYGNSDWGDSLPYVIGGATVILVTRD